MTASQDKSDKSALEKERDNRLMLEWEKIDAAYNLELMDGMEQGLVNKRDCRHQMPDKIIKRDA